MHALNPSTITSRRSRLSYGIRHCRPWSDDCPAGTKVEYSQEDGGPRCNARFSKYITIGEDVEVESEAVHTFHPITRTQTSVAFDIFGVPRKDAKWTTEPGMVKVGTVEISIKGTIHNAYDYDLRAVMKFGTATIEVRVTDMQTGMTARSEVVFSAS